MEYNSEDKYQSMLRAFESLRVYATDIGTNLVIGAPGIEDVIEAFFCACYHFKDWLKKDRRIKNPEDIELFISNSKALSLAADLCNSFKHAGLDKAPRSGLRLEKINRAYSLSFPPPQQKGRPVATDRVVFTFDGKKYDALDLAAQCVREWDIFLATVGIVFSKPM